MVEKQEAGPYDKIYIIDIIYISGRGENTIHNVTKIGFMWHGGL
jgi:hypothetical protein